jgi:hypothetical protein
VTNQGRQQVSTPEEIFEVMDGLRQHAEAIGGLRRQLVEEQGFDPEFAQLIVVEIIRALIRGDNK